MAERLQNAVQCMTFGELQTDTAVTRELTGGGENQVAGAGQAENRVGLRAHGRAQACDLGEAARDEGGARVVPEAETVADARRDGHYVLHRATDLHAHEVGAVVHAHAPAVHDGGGLPGERGVARGERERARQTARDLLRERGPRERAATHVGTERLLDDLVRKKPAAPLEALAEPNDRRLALRLFRHAA